MKKTLLLLTVIVSACLISGLYGVLHDQFTYSVSEEYYTLFKFQQFGIDLNHNPVLADSPRLAVSMVAFLASWWMGLPAGIILGLTALILLPTQLAVKASLKALLIGLLTAFGVGLLGLAYGHFLFSQGEVNWVLPEGLKDRDAFITVGTMHNFTYAGGIVGIVSGIIVLVKYKVPQAGK